MDWRRLICTTVCIMLAAVVSADTLIYSNSTLQGYFTPGASNEIFDFGSSSGGYVSKFAFGYRSSYQISWARVTFYASPQLNYLDPGYQIASFVINNIPSSAGSYRVHEYVLPEENRFNLPSGYFGYSITLGSSTANLTCASGGPGQYNEMWEYKYGIYGWDWYPFWFGGAPWAGLYFKVYSGPPINQITCDITGWKFNDANGDGVWDTNESAMTGWEFFLDTNNDGIYQVSEPNTVTDPNGFYMFENLPSPATYRVREVMQQGWSQTLPGSAANYQYLIATEPNTVYGPLNFGNTTMPQSVTFSGYVTKENDEPFAGIRVDLDLDGNVFTYERTTYTDTQGRYVFSLDVPWTGTALVRLPEGWVSHWSVRHENVTTNMTEDFLCYYRYDGGTGTLSSPYRIRTAEQLLMIDTLESHWDKIFVLTGDIDLAGTVYNAPIIASVLYNSATAFSGTFDGAGFSIRNLEGSSGLFGLIRNGLVKNLRVENANITGAVIAGIICNFNQGGTISNCFTSGTIEGLYDIGGICGWSFREYKGELMYIPGWTWPDIDMPVITGCLSTADVTTRCPSNSMTYLSWNTAGGLCGYAEDAQLNNNYTKGTIQGIGCWHMADVAINVKNGGLAGQVENCTILNCYSASTVVSGLAYSTPGGLCGRVTGSGNYLAGNYWDTQVSGQLTSAFGAPKTTAQMKTMGTYSGWDFTGIWRICDGMNYPRLKWEPLPVGDFVCPEGVELADVIFMADQWLLTGPSDADIAPTASDGKINLQDFALLTLHWMEGTD